MAGKSCRFESRKFMCLRPPRGECDLKLFGRIERKKLETHGKWRGDGSQEWGLNLVQSWQKSEVLSIAPNLAVGYATWAGGRKQLACR